MRRVFVVAAARPRVLVNRSFLLKFFFVRGSTDARTKPNTLRSVANEGRKQKFVSGTAEGGRGGGGGLNFGRRRFLNAYGRLQLSERCFSPVLLGARTYAISLLAKSINMRSCEAYASCATKQDDSTQRG